MVFSFRLQPHTRLPCSVTKSKSGTRRSTATGAVAASFSVTLPSRLCQVVPVRPMVQLP